MKLRISRSQKTTGIVSSTVIFCLDARTELTPEETADVKKYKLGKQVIYNSRRAKDYLSRAEDNLASSRIIDLLKSFLNLFMAKAALNITIDSLVRGHHIEAKDIHEAIEAEEALRAACEHMKRFLAVAATFNGTEEVVDY